MRNSWKWHTSFSHKLLQSMRPVHFCHEIPRFLKYEYILPNSHCVITQLVYLLTNGIISKLRCYCAQKHHFYSLIHTISALTKKCIYVCMYEKMYVCMYVWKMYVFMYVWKNWCMYICKKKCMYVFMFEKIYVCMYKKCVYVYMYKKINVCMYQKMYGCMYVW